MDSDGDWHIDLRMGTLTHLPTTVMFRVQGFQERPSVLVVVPWGRQLPPDNELIDLREMAELLYLAAAEYMEPQQPKETKVQELKDGPGFF